MFSIIFRSRYCATTSLGLIAMLVGFATAALADEPAPNQRQAQFEQRFLTDMIDHHGMAVMMAELCTGRVIHQELAALCERIVETQSSEIEEMQAWLRDWYGVDHEPTMTNKMSRQMDDLAALNGADFERAFLDMMIEHHEQAIREAERCVSRAWHDELIRMCQSMASVQQEEVRTMEGWLCSWYQICERR